MPDTNEISVLDLKLRGLLASLEKDDALPEVRAPGREKRMIGLQDEITVTVITKFGEQESIRDWLTSNDFKFSGTKGIFLVKMPVRALRKVEKLPGIRSVQASADLFLPRLNSARSAARLDYGRQIFPDLTGKNVVIATVDSGLDWRHGDFRHVDGKTRVAYYAWWSGGWESSSRRTEPKYEYKAEEIDKALNWSLDIPYRDPTGHGTHCMSIAAGNGRASADGIFQGVAPEATIMALGTKDYPDQPILWSIEKFFKLAGSQPLVFSISIGNHRGSHDGTYAVEEAIKQYSDVGKIFVVAAGNEAEDGIHWQGKVREGKDTIIPVRVGDDTYQWVDVWIPKGDEFDAWVETPDRVQYKVILEDTERKTVFGDFKFYRGPENNNEKTRVILEIINGRLKHTWRILIRGVAIGDGRIHAWSGTDEPETTAHLFPGALKSGYTVSMPATVEEAIVVGSFVSQPKPEGIAPSEDIKTTLRAGNLSPFSSLGPTRTGLPKPDIVAPGQYITAAMASDSVFAKADQYLPRHYELGPYVATQGTSMSAPFVAGVVALMLQRCNTLTPKDVRELLKESARKPRGVKLDEDKWHPGFGYGLLDIEELFKKLDCR